MSRRKRRNEMKNTASLLTICGRPSTSCRNYFGMVKTWKYLNPTGFAKRLPVR